MLGDGNSTSIEVSLMAQRGRMIFSLFQAERTRLKMRLETSVTGVNLLGKAD